MIVVSRVDLEYLFPRRLASSSITLAKTLQHLFVLVSGQSMLVHVTRKLETKAGAP
jgi:hypothetical protein